MEDNDLSQALELLFENFWLVRKTQPEAYRFIRRNEVFLKKELKTRFGMKLIIRNHYIQLLKRPPILRSWMGDIGLTSKIDYILLCLAMAYIEGMDADKAFMLDELIREIELMKSEEIYIDWTNYNHRKSLVRVIRKMLDFHVIETIQGETEEFEQSEHNQEILFVTTDLARSFLTNAPQSFSEYQDFNAYWLDWQESQHTEGNQFLFQQLMMTPIIQRTPENEDTFIRLRNYHYFIKPYFADKSFYNFELYQDYAALTLEQRDKHSEVFPSRKVIDEITIQLATICRKYLTQWTPYGIGEISLSDWEIIIMELKNEYGEFWSKEFSEKSLRSLNEALLSNGKEWELFEEKNEVIYIYPVFSRLVAEMRNEDE
ncbi:TIGR02678 family protein [Vagococcus fluvialis]|uniref:TIGR02678 family protein n=1 Tax=Vagococcus fluvialis TaxID=2738 RepID=UPI0037AEC401